MSSLNQAFIKAYGRDASSTTTDAAPPEPTPSAPQSQVLGNWYAADTWYRAETAVTPVERSHASLEQQNEARLRSTAPVAPPHVSFQPAYQPPDPRELSQLLARRAPRAEELDYRLSPAESVPAPEVIVEEEPAAPQFVAPPPAAKFEAAPPVPKAAPSAPVDPPKQVQAVVVASPPALDQLFSPVQVTTGWEATLGMFPPVTTVASPVTSVPAAPPAPKPSAKPEADASGSQVSAPPQAKAAPVVTPRLDAAVAPPVPKPHTTFTPPPAPIEAPVAKASKPSPPPPAAKAPAPEPAPAPKPASAPVEAKPEPAPLGLIQPAWEVDRFQWPEHCKLLLNTESEYLADVGKRLANAAQDGLNILAVTSTRRGEGRTTLALCLARAAAQAGVKVALVDADMENPQLINELGVEATCGWQDVVLGTQPLAEAAIVSLEDRFTFFPWTPGGALKSLNDPRATRVLREIAKAWSLVVIDLGPVPGRETRMFEDGEACPIDAAILVRDVRWTSALEAQRVAAQLTEAGVESVGIAENFGPKTVASGQ